MTKYLCYKCNKEYPCVYIDPIGELDNADHIKCNLNDAKWLRERCGCCGGGYNYEY